MFYSKPSGGPDAVGGLFPVDFPEVNVMNRTGETLAVGDTVMLALSAAGHEATEIATNDSNSYKPGFSNDTVWNTVVDPRATTGTNGVPGTLTGGIFGIVTGLGTVGTGADNTVVKAKFFGLVERAFVIDSGTSKDGAQPGQVLTVTSTNSLNCHVGTNAVLVGFYCDAQDTTLTSRALKRVFLTNGMFLTCNGAQTNGLLRS